MMHSLLTLILVLVSLHWPPARQDPPKWPELRPRLRLRLGHVSRNCDGRTHFDAHGDGIVGAEPYRDVGSIRHGDATAHNDAATCCDIHRYGDCAAAGGHTDA